MPHVVIDFAEGLERSHDMSRLCEEVFDALVLDVEVNAPALKVRARPQPYFKIGTEPDTFAHATLYLLEGRNDATKARLSDIVLKAMDGVLPTVGSLSVDVRDMNTAAYAKRLKG
ncbi:5-carboxymethyl-2-hydroxymuconate Delta-isomerase [Celeribacter halophilus]|uniref:5-carboxymethyl-2-hydroxymuconate isomerase n=1 Tax=Celeribacter halophilus TaxID=576117 RepID=A0A1I3VTL9_9RHOB|nr:5-carboxymethyl-2-hydroxymuconate isomerase [Celeribacter halophilus]PZX08416.1 5-carboxymethyl-2-hydroxymuconate isomerase [Celeribacter halophilus]SFJ97491.1 5-carboxymethyl-2-hydroxymuconate isomerase [Celeribacter halophilus]